MDKTFSVPRGFSRRHGQSKPVVWSMLFLFCTLLAIFGVTSVRQVQAQDCTATYTVQVGDSWYKIADKCGASFSSLTEANPDLYNRRGSYVRPGDQMMIPGAANAQNSEDTAAAEAETATEATAASAGASVETSVAADPFVYTVRPGDYWIFIARKYQTEYGALREANPALWMKRGEIIRPGDQVVVPGLTAVDMIPPVQYTVESGDSWYKIADKFAVSFWHLILDNPALWGRRGPVIRPGDEMVITEVSQPPTQQVAEASTQTSEASAETASAETEQPATDTEMETDQPAVDQPEKETSVVIPVAPVREPVPAPQEPVNGTIYTVGIGDSWYKIANRFGISFYKLRSANPALWVQRGQALRPGDKMVIPEHGTPPPPPEIKSAPGEKEPATGEAPDAEIDTIPSGSYTVQEGDTWASIAERAGVTVEALQTANPAIVRKDGSLTPGDVMRIP